MEYQCQGFDFTDEFVEAVAGFSEAQIRGENPDLDEYVARYPQFAPRLRELLEVSEWLRRSAGRVRRRRPGLAPGGFDPGACSG